MNHGEGHTIYMLGIGGIGMSALARYYQHKGYTVAGYDRYVSPLTRQLEHEGMAIHYEDNPNLQPAQIDFVVYSPAVKRQSCPKEYESLDLRNLTIIKRAAALGKVTEGHFNIAVAGTHGKTTTTAMVAHILNQCGKATTAFIGGLAKNFDDSNLLYNDEDECTMVVEADEFDHSFLQLHPDISIINSIDADHLDIYGDRQHLVQGFNDFAGLTQQKVILKECLAVDTNRGIRFGFGDSNDYQAIILRSEKGVTDFVIQGEGSNTEIRLPMAGKHNVLNATAAFIAARQIGLQPEAIAEALSSFAGVKRRFYIRVNNEKHCYIDDYAHHPEEIRSCLTAVKEAYQGKPITLVFQPHLYSRTRDFMDGFAEVLALADELILLDIYPARELPIEGITSQALLDKIQMTNKRLCQKSDLIGLIESEKPKLLVTMGAGDIDRFVEPLENMIMTW